MVTGSCAGHLSSLSLFSWTTSYLFFFSFYNLILFIWIQIKKKMYPEDVWFVFCLDTKRCSGWTAAWGWSGNNLVIRSVEITCGRHNPVVTDTFFFFLRYTANYQIDYQMCTDACEFYKSRPRISLTRIYYCIALLYSLRTYGSYQTDNLYWK